MQYIPINAIILRSTVTYRLSTYDEGIGIH